ncbi:MAG TPA: peptidylprolyl isomerase [Verrucomicrobiae bacterium]|jgi:parvulin-like peptidyl-prolyl isomerase
MKNTTKLIISGTLGMALLAGWGMHAATASAPMAPAASDAAPAAAADTNNPSAAMASLFGDPVIAKGKGVEIKQSRLDEVAAAVKANAGAQGQPVSDEDLTRVEAMALNEFICTALLLQKATEADRAQGKVQADKAIAALVKEAGSMDALQLRLKGAGKTLDGYRSDLNDSMTANAVLVRDLGVSVSDADIKKFYDDHPTDFEQPEQAHVRHILFATEDITTRQPLSDDAKQAKLKQAQSVLKQLRGGADFAALAKQYSDDPGSKDNGGELQPFGHGEMVPEFDTAAFSLTNNQISDIVTSQYGYHIIQLLDKTAAQKVDLSKVTDGIKAYLLRQKLAPVEPAYLQKLKKDADVQILDNNLKAEVTTLDEQQANTNTPPASATTP